MHAMIFQAAMAAFALSLSCLLLLRLPALRRLMLDRPNERSLHEQAVPRSGGLALAAGVAGASLLVPELPATTLAAAAALVALSLLDDLFVLPTLVRLAAHVAASAAVLALEIVVGDPLGFGVLLLALVWSTNLYNFMDGADGLAGGMAVIGFGAYAFAAHLGGLQALAGLSGAIAAAAAAFLLWNFPPARIFMGDAGSIPLGFLAGAFGLIGWRAGAWPLWFPALVFAPFACDATLTLLRRLLRGEKVWHAHREHYYQRLVRMGFGHRGTAWIEYGAMACCALAALAVRDAGAVAQAGALGAAILALAGLAVWVDARWAKHQVAACPKGNA
jgi:UDP-N-acetylmuramyl pentapeptide phosphotransferase/UDP-N-acetylglucosamine-1-phosphate transferase